MPDDLKARALADAAGAPLPPPPIEPLNDPVKAKLIADAGRPEWDDERQPVDDRISDYLRTNARAGNDWQKVVPGLAKFGVADPGKLGPHFALEQERAKAADQTESTLHKIVSRSIPFGSAVRGFELERRYGNAVERLKNNEATPYDVRLIAYHERLQELDKQRTTGEAVGMAALHIPALVGEMVVTGPAATAGRLGRVGLAARLGGKEAANLATKEGIKQLVTREGLKNVAASTPGYVGRTATQTALSPSMYLENAARKANETGGNWYDPSNLGSSYAMGVAQNMVLGQVAKGVPGAPGGMGGRLIGRTALGLGEQQLVDVGATGFERTAEAITGKKLGLETHWGLGGDIAEIVRNPNSPEPVKRAVVQAATFAMFAAMHAHDKGRGTPEKATGIVDAFGKAAKESPVEDLTAATAGGKADIGKRLETMPDGAMKDYVKAVHESLPDNWVPEVPMAKEADRGPVAGPPEAVPTPEPVGPKAEKPPPKQTRLLGAGLRKPTPEPVVEKPAESAKWTAPEKVDLGPVRESKNWNGNTVHDIPVLDPAGKEIGMIRVKPNETDDIYIDRFYMSGKESNAEDAKGMLGSRNIASVMRALRKLYPDKKPGFSGWGHRVGGAHAFTREQKDARVEAANQAREQANRPAEPVVPVDRAEPKVSPRETTITRAGAPPIPARYELRELADVQASHNVQDEHAAAIHRNEGYPSGLQPRDYTRDAGEREKVRRIGGPAFDPRQLLADVGDATAGAPTITRDGNVAVNGNGRLMGLQLAARNGRIAAYRELLRQKAKEYGIDVAEVDRMKNPVLVRVVDMKPDSAEAREFASQGNVSQVQEQSPVRVANNYVRMLDGIDLGKLDLDGATLGELLNESSGREFRDSLLREMQTNAPTQVNRYFRDDGKLNDAGKELVRKMLLLKVGLPVETVERLEDSRQLSRTLEAASPEILRIERESPKGGFVQALTEAVDRITGPDGRNYRPDAARGLFGGEPMGELAYRLYRHLRDQGGAQVKFREMLKRVAKGEAEAKANLFDAADTRTTAERAAEAFDVPGAMHSGIPIALPDLSGWLKSLDFRGIGPKAMLGKWFKSRGNAPSEEAYQLNERRKGKIAEQIRKIEYADRDLRKQTNGYRLTPQQTESLNKALGGDLLGAGYLPPALLAKVTEMRQAIDGFSRAIVNMGVGSPELRATITANEGMYLHRSYQVHTDPNWRATMERVDPGARKHFQDWYQAEHLKNNPVPLTQAELDSKTDQYLYDAKAAEKEPGYLATRKLGELDRRILMEKKDVPEPVRRLFGENRDALYNFAETTTRQVSLLANKQFQQELVKLGLKEGWMSAPGGNTNPRHIATLADKGQKGLEDLAGYKVAPETDRWLSEIYEKPELPAAMRLALGVIGIAKMAPTVLSHAGGLRNYYSNIKIALEGGHLFNLRAHWEAIKTLWNDTAADRARKLEYERGGLLHDGVHEGSVREVTDMLLAEKYDRMDPRRFAGMMTAKSLHLGARKTLNALANWYGAMDAVFKISAYEQEKVNYSRAFPHWTPEQVQEYAANIVKDIYPTRSRASRIVRAQRWNPLTAPFPTFPAEIVRTTKNRILLTKAEYLSGNPELRRIAMRRMAGMAASYGMTIGLIAASYAATGMDLDDEFALRRGLPEWSRNSPLVMIENPNPADRKRYYADLGQMDPDAYLFKMAMAPILGGSAADRAKRTAGEAADPFLSWQPLTKAVAEAWMNETEAGGHVYQPGEPDSTVKAGAIAKHVGKPMVPGSIVSLDKWLDSLQGTPNPKTGKTRNPLIETLAMGGLRIGEYDPEVTTRAAGARFTRSKADASAIMNSSLRSHSPGDARGAYLRAEEARDKAYGELKKDVQAVLRLGLTEEEVAKQLKDVGVPKEDIAMAIGQGYRPLTPSQRSVRRTPEAVRETRMQAIRDAMDGKPAAEKPAEFMGMQLPKK